MSEEDLEGGSLVAIVLEMEALDAVLHVVEGSADADEARARVRTALTNNSRAAKNLDERVILAAMRRIIGQQVEIPSSQPTNAWLLHVRNTLAIAWVEWSIGEVASARSRLAYLCTEKAGASHLTSGAIQLMSLRFWEDAIEHLIAGDRAGAQRLFRRALDVGSQFGTETHTLVSWAYAATFFPEEEARESLHQKIIREN